VEEIIGRRSEDEEAPGSFALAAALIDDPAKFGKQTWHAVNLVKDDEALALAFKKEAWLGQFGSVITMFEIEIERVPALSDAMSERRFAHLPRAEQSHGGLTRQAIFDGFQDLSFKHPCILSIKQSICNDILLQMPTT
jgi:hypothetical protein